MFIDASQYRLMRQTELLPAFKVRTPLAQCLAYAAGSECVAKNFLRDYDRSYRFLFTISF